MLEIHMIFENKHSKFLCFVFVITYLIIGHIGINQSILHQQIIQSSISSYFYIFLYS